MRSLLKFTFTLFMITTAYAFFIIPFTFSWGLLEYIHTNKSLLESYKWAYKETSLVLK